ncbi:MAG: DUF1566 domain-containing protein [Nitrospirae bacterium]|nr:DUF1566 domain-containing protein [Nitrospirota bacterium]
MRRSRSAFVMMLLTVIVLCMATNAYSRRFKDNGDGSMTDTLTDLVWMKNANPCGAVTWKGAFACVKKLGDGWRVPTIKELYSLCNHKGSKEYSKRNAKYEIYCMNERVDVASLLSKEGFTGVQSYYWSSNTYSLIGYNTAWFVHMIDGTVDGYNKSGENYVWPVRSGRRW